MCDKSFKGGRIIDNWQIDNRQINNLTNFRQIDKWWPTNWKPVIFKKIDLL